MLFNSFEFLVFFPIVTLVYFALPHRFRLIFLLLASYYFYMCWRPEYIVLILASTLVDYFAGLGMSRTDERKKRRKFLLMSLFANLGLLFTFKYFNFFADSLSHLFAAVRVDVHMPALDVLLPVGISFYTFQTLSYTIDVYRGETQPEKNPLRFALYVAFFPQLVAGPIERSTRLLKQFYRKVSFSEQRLRSGLMLILWGLFKKVVIADRLAIYVNEAYNHPGDYQGWPLILATYFFAFQIYCDFSGYSDIAIGSARILGFDLMENFRQPYFAKSISEFWKRWHISLSTWFRDYLYIPLGGNRVVKWRWYYNLMVVFLVSGLWHGANWTFVVWGALHGFYLIFSIWTQTARAKIRAWIGLARRPRLQGLWQTVVTFHLVLVAWVFFRANSLSDAMLILHNMSQIDFSWRGLMDINIELGWGELMLVMLFIVVMELVHLLQSSGKWVSFSVRTSQPLRLAVFYGLLLCIVFFGVYNHTEFIYFQF
ncbi:MAG: MBOAT family O-acyltransferase [candidate division KSB1 bacterium]|nr:MBOAT family O-acyltransferase [candidate division KSB1 bacterium]